MTFKENLIAENIIAFNSRNGITVWEYPVNQINADRNTITQNSPNPFRFSTSIQHVLPERVKVSLQIYDVAGNLVKTLVNRIQEAGNYKVLWDGKDRKGKGISAGIYFYILRTGKSKIVKKMVLGK